MRSLKYFTLYKLPRDCLWLHYRLFKIQSSLPENDLSLHNTICIVQIIVKFKPLELEKVCIPLNIAILPPCSVVVEFEKGEDPHLLVTGKYAGSGPALITLSPNGEVVAIATGVSMALFSALTGTCDKVIDNIYSNGKLIHFTGLFIS